MTGLPDDKIEIVRTLVSGAPDAVVSGLRKALVAADGDTALAGVRRVVEAEVADRNLRNKVLEPVAPLFAGDGLDADRLCFPMAALPLLWRGLRAIDPEGIARAAAVYADYEPGVSTMQPFDELVERLLEEVEAGTQRDVVAALDQIDKAKPGGRAALDAEAARLDRADDAGTGGGGAAGLSRRLPRGRRRRAEILRDAERPTGPALDDPAHRLGGDGPSGRELSFRFGTGDVRHASDGRGGCEPAGGGDLRSEWRT